MRSIFARQRQRLLALKALRDSQRHTLLPLPIDECECPRCGEGCTRRELAEELYVCPHCHYHYSIGAYYRLSILLDSGSFREMDAGLATIDPLSFRDYGNKLEHAQQKTGLREAVVTAQGTIDRHPAVFAVLDSQFLMGSMGSTVGEKITRAIEFATRKKLPLIIFSASGGARMQEGILSLMQMAKTSAALARFDQQGGLYISVFTDPTTGGVTASFASQGDILLAEPGARICFAGPRLIKQTMGQILPEGFQRSEFLEEHGLLDAIVPRNQLRQTLSQLLSLHGKGGQS